MRTTTGDARPKADCSVRFCCGIVSRSASPTRCSISMRTLLRPRYSGPKTVVQNWRPGMRMRG
jgi:hypothetical protein